MRMMVVLSAVWMAFDARLQKVTFFDGPYHRLNGSTLWLLGGMLLWPLVFPYYFLRRHKLWAKHQTTVTDPTMQQLSALKERYASGLITEAEYHKQRDLLMNR